MLAVTSVLSHISAVFSLGILLLQVAGSPVQFTLKITTAMFTEEMENCHCST
jgi:hypothetical protein